MGYILDIYLEFLRERHIPFGALHIQRQIECLFQAFHLVNRNDVCIVLEQKIRTKSFN